MLQKIDSASPGIRLYGVAPPKRDTSPDELTRIAARQMERLTELQVDGLVVYDIQDEAERIAEPRPFPFLPTVPPEDYAQRYLGALNVPKVVYRCVNRDDPASFVAWLERRHSRPALSVLVGAPSRSAVGRLSLREAYNLVQQHAPEMRLGGVAIAERHARSQDEHQRMLAKMNSGCRFFVTQAVYDVTSTLSLLSDYALVTSGSARPPTPVILTFSPCGSLKTLSFMKWLGIAVPRWIENELAHSPDPLEASVRSCVRIFSEIWEYAREKRIPVGVNVESISIRKVEVEASVRLAVELAKVIQHSPP